MPIAFLLDLSREPGVDPAPYVEAARRGGDYVLERDVAADYYAGGTLDNPNIVDKEAAMYAMHALLALFAARHEPRYLDGARRAAQLAITWNILWDVPLVPGTPVARAGVRSTGWGGINSIWGAGVADIYTLFMLQDFVSLARLTGEPLYEAVADLVAAGTQQMLSYPGNLYGFAGPGMQPEGIAFCNQGVDDGLIAKGDRWGGLGWIYSAGTFGLHNYLSEKRRRH